MNQYLALYKLKIKVGDHTVRYIPKCPRSYQSTNPVYYKPVKDEETGQIHYVKNIIHKKKPIKKIFFNIIKEISRIRENIFNPPELIHQQMLEDKE